VFSIISGHQCPAYRNVFQVHSALTTDRRREAACAVALRRRAAHFTVCWACSVFTRRKGHDIISHTHTHTHRHNAHQGISPGRPAARRVVMSASSQCAYRTLPLHYHPCTVHTRRHHHLRKQTYYTVPLKSIPPNRQR